MNPINFVYWLQGFLEIGNPTTLDEKQVQEIKNHIELVLEKKTDSLRESAKFLADNKFSINDTLKAMSSLNESSPPPSNMSIKIKYPTIVYYNKEEGEYKDWWGK